MECQRKDIKGLKATIARYESSLRTGQEGSLASADDSSDTGARGAEEADMATTSVADDTPTVRATPEPSTSPPDEEQALPMEVEDGNDHQTPASPVSHWEDELLTGGEAVGVEREMASLKVSSPEGHEDSDGGASI